MSIHSFKKRLRSEIKKRRRLEGFQIICGEVCWRDSNFRVKATPEFMNASLGWQMAEAFNDRLAIETMEKLEKL